MCILISMPPSEGKRAVATKAGGSALVDENHVIRIIDGLVGFSEYENFALIPQANESPFLWLQSMDDPKLAFITIDPRVFAPQYVPAVLGGELKVVGLERIESGIVLAIVVIPEDPRRMTANLLGPVIINPVTRLGRQVISQSPEHSIRHLILPDDPDGPKKTG